MASNLFIGIGTTGLQVLEEIQQNYYEFTGQNCPENTKYLFFETDVSRKPRHTSSGKTSISDHPLSLKNHEASIRDLKSNGHIDSEWVPPVNVVLNNEEGAGGLPAYGRLSFWGHGNYNMVKSVIKDAYHRIRGQEDTQIYIIGSLSGGTGSGLCIDIAYLVREITRCSNIKGIFLLPPESQKGVNNVLFFNAYSALLGINYYSDLNNKYKITWPDGTEYESESPPFQYVSVLTPDFDGARASLRNVNELIRVVGIQLFQFILDSEIPGISSFQNLLSRRRVDSTSNNRIDKYISAGSAMIEYPKSRITEIMALDITREILNLWISENEFIDRNGNRLPPVAKKDEIEREERKEFEKILMSALDSLDSVPGPSGVIISQSIASDVNSILRKSHGKPSELRFVFDQFSTTNTNNYFQVIKSNIGSAQDRIIEGIYQRISTILDEKQNLIFNQFQIDEIVRHIDKLKAFWTREFGVTGDEQKWDTLIQRKCTSLFSGTFFYKSLGQYRSYLEDGLSQILFLCKLHCLIERLDLIKEHLVTPELPLKSTSTGTRLPSLKQIAEIRKQIQNVLEGEDQNHKKCFSQRRAEIINDLSNDSLNIFRVYLRGSLDEELRVLKAEYSRPSASGKKIEYKTISDGKPLWPYFESHPDLFEDCVFHGINQIEKMGLIGDQNVLRIIEKLEPNRSENERILNFFRKDKHIIKSQVPAMVKLGAGRQIFFEEEGAKLIYSYSNINELKQFLPFYQIAPNMDNACELPSLKNAVIIYQEYGYMGDNTRHFNPLLHMSYMDSIRALIKAELSRNKKNNDPDFFQCRVPYVTEDYFLQSLETKSE